MLIINAILSCSEGFSKSPGGASHGFCTSLPNGSDSEIQGLKSVPDTGAVRYETWEYTITVLRSELNRQIEEEIRCQSDSSRLAQILRLQKKILEPTVMHCMSREDSTVLERFLIQLGGNRKVCLTRGNEEDCRSYRITTGYPMLLPLCGSTPIVTSLEDFDPGREFKNGKARRAKAYSVVGGGIISSIVSREGDSMLPGSLTVDLLLPPEFMLKNVFESPVPHAPERDEQRSMYTLEPPRATE